MCRDGYLAEFTLISQIIARESPQKSTNTSSFDSNVTTDAVTIDARTLQSNIFEFECSIDGTWRHALSKSTSKDEDGNSRGKSDDTYLVPQVLPQCKSMGLVASAASSFRQGKHKRPLCKNSSSNSSSQRPNGLWWSLLGSPTSSVASQSSSLSEKNMRTMSMVFLFATCLACTLVSKLFSVKIVAYLFCFLF